MEREMGRRAGEGLSVDKDVRPDFKPDGIFDYFTQE
jgi:hypothetical protein